MTSITLIVAIAASFLILILRPFRGLVLYLIVLMWYPTYLVISLGTLDIPASRIIITILLIKCLLNNGLISRFKLCALDKWVVFYMLVCVTIPCISNAKHTFMQSLENRSGFLMDTLFVYIVARLCLVKREEMMDLIKWIGLASIPLAVLGIIETTTGWQPFAALQYLCPWAVPTIFKLRFGLFHRACGPFDQPILFGSFFVMLLPLVFYLRNAPNYPRILIYLLCGIIITGIFSSMSSGPWIMMVAVIFCIVMERFKNWIKSLLIGFVFFCIFIDITSDRSFHHVLLTRLNPAGGAAWHRAKIIDSAIRTFNEWWLVGYRGLEPGWMQIAHTDVTNFHVLNGIRYGILGIIGFWGILICGILEMSRLHNRSNDRQLRSWAWALGITIVIVFLSCLGSNLRGQVQFLFYIILGIVGSSSNLAPKTVRIPVSELSLNRSVGINCP